MFSRHRARTFSSSAILLDADFTALSLSDGTNSAALVTALAKLGLSFARNSSATVQTSASTLVITGIGNDQPKFGSNGTTYGLGLDFEESRTNTLQNCRDLTAANWSAGTATFTATNGILCPDGSTRTTGRITAALGQYSKYAATGPWTAGAKTTISGWYMGVGAPQPSTRVAWLTSPGTNALATFPVTTSWGRYTGTTTTSGGATTGNVAPIDQATGGNATGASDCYVDILQLEEGGFATNAIITTSASATRAGERLYLTKASGIAPNGRLSIAIEFSPKASRTSYNGTTYLFTDSSTGLVCTFDPTTGTVTLTVGSVTYTSQLSLPNWSAFDSMKLYIEVGNGQPWGAYQQNGGTPVDLAFPFASTSHPSVLLGGLDILCNGTSSQLSSYVRRVTLYGQ